MTGTIINIAAILLGGTMGLLFGSRLPHRIRQTVVSGLGLFTGVIGLQMAFEMEGVQQALVVLASLLIGGLLGEWWRIEHQLSQLGSWLEKRFGGSTEGLTTTPAENPSANPAFKGEPANPSSRFIRGFLTASLLYTIGPMTILGSIQDGLSGDYSLLAIKSVLDGFASLAFASSLGVGVLFSSLVVLVYQGSLSMMAFQAKAVITPEMMSALTATGGVLLVGIAISSLLEIKPIRVGNFLPALVIAPLLMAILAAFGI
jgi:uncharacterized membrane protein YqgA involved in biofilm formation